MSYITDNEKLRSVIDILLISMPYYGAFKLKSLLYNSHLPLDKEGRPYGNIILLESDISKLNKYLIDFGYVNKRIDITEPDYIEFTRRGRWLKECGSLNAYDRYQSDKKLKIHEEKERALLLEEKQMAYQDSQAKLNVAQADALAKQVEYQKRLNKLTGWIALGTIIAAIYYIIQTIQLLLSS